jgi:thiol-disulfide isomerase/thioredoxin
LLASLVIQACATTPSSSGPLDVPSAAHLYEVRLPRSGGGEVELSAFRGKVLLIDFFATWLNSSLASIPGYIALYQRHHEHGLEMVGISMDDYGDRVVAPFVKVMGIPYPVALADHGVREGHSTFGDLSALPQLMVFDREGELVKVVFGTVPALDLDRLVQDLLSR